MTTSTVKSIELIVKNNSLDVCTVKKHYDNGSTTTGLLSFDSVLEIFQQKQENYFTGLAPNLLGVKKTGDVTKNIFYYPSIIFDFKFIIRDDYFRLNGLEFTYKNHNISINMLNDYLTLQITNVEFKNNLAIITQNDNTITNTFFGYVLSNSVVQDNIELTNKVFRYPLTNYFTGDQVCWPSTFSLSPYVNNPYKQSKLILQYLNSLFNSDLCYYNFNNYQDIFSNLNPELTALCLEKIPYNRYATFLVNYLLLEPDQQLQVVSRMTESEYHCTLNSKLG